MVGSWDPMGLYINSARVLGQRTEQMRACVSFSNAVLPYRLIHHNSDPADSAFLRAEHGE